MSDVVPQDLADALSASRHRFSAPVDLRYFDEIDSTNTFALSLAGSGAPEGTAVLAGVQREGRGRRGRTWHSPPGAGLYLSCIVRFDKEDRPGPLLTLAAGVAVAGAIAASAALPVELKWPNDVVIGRPWRKLAGILCEAVAGRDGGEAIVVGVGVNVLAAAYPPELRDRASSIEVELGRPIERASLVVECLARVFDAARRLRAGNQRAILQDWRRLGRNGLAGVDVQWQEHGGARRGRTRGIDDDGALLVDSDGHVERIVAGEVTWERLT